MDKLFIQDLSFYGYHGALPEENVLGQIYRISLTFEVDTREAARTDDLDLTVDYRQAIEIVRDVITGPSHKLIETLADLIATRLLLQIRRAQAVTVRLTKPNPPVGVDLPAVTIEIHRERGHA